MMVKLALFDFDGTMTSKDSLIDFIIYSFGVKSFLMGCISISPTISGSIFGITSRSRAKEKLLSYYLKDLDFELFKKMSSKYSRQRLPAILKQHALRKLYWHKSQGHKVAIVSASIEHWLHEWCKRNGIDLIATKLETENDKLTGKFFPRNCKGIEKVRRIKETYNLTEFSYIYAYGDSPGDKEMLEIADERYYKWKRVT
jgi:HAD superfamily hydrolase (TIGR01490 family)